MTCSRSLSLVLSLAAALGACTEWKPPPPPPGVLLVPPDPTPRKRPVARVSAPAVAPFAALRDRVLDGMLERRPGLGRALGLHDHDGKVGDYSAAGLAAQLAWFGAARAELARFDGAKLTPDEALDRALLLREADLTLLRLGDLAEWKTKPQFYEELFSVDDYIVRAYAPLDERARRLLAHEQAALAQVPNIRKNLVSPMSKPVLETAVKVFKGYAEYLRGDVVKLLAGAGTPAFQATFAQVNEALAKEAEALATHLEKDELPKGDSSHVLGPERFKKLLLAQEGLTLSLADFKKLGEEDLAANKKAYDQALRKAKVTRPKESALLGAATRRMESARAFLVEKKLVTIPSDDAVAVKESPPYMRWNAAFLNPPGPFETAAVPAFYYISLPDPTWKKAEREAYVPTDGILLATTVHEVWPGHFLQGLWVRKAPTRVQKVLTSYSFEEGWAHYGERMMIEEGYGAEDPQNRVGQLSDALLRNCRLVVSIGIHTEGMTLAQAEKRFLNDCHQDKATAHEQAVRGTFDPGYFAYTLGKVQILKLRDEAKQKLGARFSLQKFHDALLAHGTPPVALIHDRVLADLGAGG